MVGFVFPIFNSIGFVVVVVVALVLSLKKLEWGLGIVFVELIVGSFGQMFSVSLGGTSLSIRVALFVVVMGVYAMQTLRGFLYPPRGSSANLQGLWLFVKSKMGLWYVALAVVIVYATINGFMRNSFDNTFFDLNNWLYFLYVLPVVSLIYKQEARSQRFTAHDDQLPNSTQSTGVEIAITLFTASITVLAVKTILLEYFFAHQIPGTIKMLYQWTRDFRFGEITFYTQNFYRVFLQSHIWLLVGFFVLLVDITINISNILITKFRNYRWIIFLLFLITTALIISFSRSLWVSWVFGIGMMGLLLLFRQKWQFLKILKWGSGVVCLMIVAVAFIFALINIPPVITDEGLGTLLSERVTVIEEAGSSRLNLLQPLWMEIKKNPIMGSGFGTTVTYNSVDLRNLVATAGASGEYTTYAFEWGYLDLLLKFGFFGTTVYVGFLMFLLHRLYAQMKFSITNFQLSMGLLISLGTLIVVHIFTPYLNHPLGIGFIVLVTGYLIQVSNDKYKYANDKLNASM